MGKQTRISLLLLGGAVLSSILHNAVSGVFGFEEPVFFSLTLILFFAFLVSIPYNIFIYIRKRKSSKRQSAPGGKQTKKDQEKIKERLRNLGYW